MSFFGHTGTCTWSGTLMKVLESAPSGRQTNNNMSGFGTGLLFQGFELFKLWLFVLKVTLITFSP